jgi:transcriptional regulator with XRE-family HTH domain
MKKSFVNQQAGDVLLTVDGSAVQSARKAARLSQMEVAQRLEELGYPLSQSYVSRVEHNTCPHRFGEREVTAFAAVLGVGVTEIANCHLLMNKEVGRVRELTSEIDDLLGKVAV